MCSVIVEPSVFSGEVCAPQSKSFLIRALICAALCDGVTTLTLTAPSDDVKAAINCISTLGTEVRFSDNILTVNGTPCVLTGEKENSDIPIILNCMESAAVLRFLIPITSTKEINVSYTGALPLAKRPIDELLNCLSEKGAQFSSNKLPFNVKGTVKSGDYVISGKTSSQYISGLLLALPLLDGDSKIIIKDRLVSAPYVDMTVSVMERFGVFVQKTDYGYSIKGGQKYKSCVFNGEGDFSCGAFFLCMGAINGSVSVRGLNENSLQGDKKICDILKRFGADVKTDRNTVSVTHKCLHGIEVDAENIPDLVPAISAVAASADGVTRIKNIGRLALKESNRVRSVCEMINSVGGCAELCGDTIIIKGKSRLNGGKINSYNDHRIVMAASILSGVCTENIEISGADSVSKSYHGFFDDFAKAGGVYRYVGR